MKNRAGWLTSLAGGLVLWSYSNWAQGTQEPWDGQDFWSIYLPLALGLSFVLGLVFPEKPWRWALAVMLTQLPVMILSGAGFGPLIVVGVALLLGYSLIGALFAWFGASIRRALERRTGG